MFRGLCIALLGATVVWASGSAIAVSAAQATATTERVQLTLDKTDFASSTVHWDELQGSLRQARVHGRVVTSIPTGLTGAASALASDHCGASIAVGDVNGDTLSDVALGCPQREDASISDAGAVYVFVRNAGNTGYNTPLLLTSPASFANAGCGTSVAVGDTNADGMAEVVMGCPGDQSSGGVAGAGTAILFSMDYTGFAFETGLTLDDATPTVSGRCGTSVAIGDLNNDGRADIAMGCKGDDVNTNGVAEGSAQVFMRNPTNTAFNAVVQVGSIIASAVGCGSSVGIGDVSGDGRGDLVIGCPVGDAGFYWFTRNAANTGFDAGIQRAPAVAPTTNQNCGAAISVNDLNADGRADVASTCQSGTGGSVRAFYSTGTAFTESVLTYAPLLGCPTSIATGDYSGDRRTDIVVGCSGAGTGSAGQLVKYTRSGSTFAAPVTVTTPTSGTNDDSKCGASLAMTDLNGDGMFDVFAGCSYDNYGSLTDTGSFVSLDGSPNVLPRVSLTHPAQAASDECGRMMAAGDVNGDGLGDVVGGCAKRDVASTTDAGSVLVATRNIGNASFNTAAELADTSPIASESCGAAVAVGDINEDGRDDVVVGCPGDTSVSGTATAGSVLVFLRNGVNSGFSAAVQLDHPAPMAGDACGAGVAIADFNGDGRGDVAMGCTGDDTGGSGAGSVIVFIRNVANSGFTSGLEYGHANPAAGDQCGTAVAGGDINADGRADLVFGCPGDDAAPSNAGSTVVRLRSTLNTGFATGTALAHPWASANTACGTSLAVGDATGDGSDDVLAGCPGDDTDASNAGGALFYERDASGNTFMTAVFVGTATPAAGDACGTAVSFGDIDGDARDDVLIGCPGTDTTVSNVGDVSLSLRNDLNNDWDAPSSVTDMSAPASEACGTGAILMDINADGLSDAIAGCPTADGTAVDSGRMSVQPSSPSAVAKFDPTGTTKLGTSMSSACMTAPQKFLSGDFNGDGRDDYAVLCTSTAQLTPYVKNAGPGFTAWSATGLSYYMNQCSTAAASDLNGDGRDDVMVNCGNDGYFNVLMSNGSALVYSNSGSTVGIVPSGCFTSVAASIGADTNSDGVGETYFGCASRLVGSSGNAYPNTTVDTKPCYALAAGDVNADGRTDLICGGVNVAYVYQRNAANTGFDLTTVNTSTCAGNGVSAVSIGDSNGDGRGDLLVGCHYANTNRGTASVFLRNAANNGFDAEYVLPQTQTGVEYCGWDVTWADVDGDGRSDAVEGCWVASAGGVTSAGAVAVYQRLPDNTGFAAPYRLATPAPTANGACAALEPANADLDARTDLYLGCNGVANVAAVVDRASVLTSKKLNRQPGTISAATITVAGTANGAAAPILEATANGGTNWISVTSGTSSNFTNPGSDLRLRITMPSSSTVSATQLIHDITVAYTYVAPPGLAITETGGITAVTEGSGPDIVKVALTSAPTQNVTVNVLGGSQLTTSPTSLTFTTTNWATQQNVNVFAVDDDQREPSPQTVQLQYATASSDTNYNNVATTPTDVAITDNDVAQPPVGSFREWSESSAYAHFDSGANPTTLFFNPTQPGSATARIDASESDAGLAYLTWPTPPAGFSPAGANDSSPLAQSSGLVGTYYAAVDPTLVPGASFTPPKQIRVDTTVDFNWGTDEPKPGMGTDNVSIRWDGRILAPETGTYYFQTYSDDGVRLYVDGAEVLAAWENMATPGTTTSCVGVAMTAATYYTIRMEYYEKDNAAEAHLRWRKPSDTGMATPTGCTMDATHRKATGFTAGTSTYATIPANVLFQPAGAGGTFERTYTWSASASSGTVNAIATGNGGLSTPNIPFTVTADSGNPTGTVQYAGGPAATASIAFTKADADSGVGAWRIQRRSTGFSSPNVCNAGTWGTWADISPSNPSTSPWVDSTLSTIGCYQYRMTLTDNVGNTAVVSDPEADTVTVQAAGIGVNQSSATTAVAEGDATGDSIGLLLTAPPANNVTIAVSEAAAQLDLSPASVTFTPANWNVEQFISVIAHQDSVDEPSPHNATITFAVTSASSTYNGMAVTPIVVPITDDDPAAPSTVSFTSWTESLPGAYVAGGTPNRLYFNPASPGSADAKVTATDSTYTVTNVTWPTPPTGWSPAGGSDSSPTANVYTRTFSWTAGALGATVNVTATNSGGTTSPPVAFEMAADAAGPVGGSVTYASGAVAGSTASIAFDQGNDGTGSGIASKMLQQRVALLTSPGVCGTFNSWADVPAATSSPYAASVTQGSCYEFRLIVTDNVGNASTFTSPNTIRMEAPGIEVVESNGATEVVEGASDGTQSDTFTVVLRTAPANTVSIALADASGQISISPSTLTFTTGTWNTPQTVTVTAVNNSVHELPATGSIGFSVSSGDSAYQGMGVAAVSVAVTDDDPALPPTLTFSSWTESLPGAYVPPANPNRIYVSPAASGSAVAVVHATDSATTVTHVTWPTPPAGWGPAGSSDTVGTAGDYARTFTWSSGATGASIYATATNAFGEITSPGAELQLVMDGAAPVGGSITQPVGSRATGPIAITFSSGNDASGSGIASTVVQRRSASVTAPGICGTFGTWNTVVAATGSPYSDAAVTQGYCYQYQLLVTDNVGNVATVASGATTRIENPNVMVAQTGTTDVTEGAIDGSEQDTFDVSLLTPPTADVTVTLAASVAGQIIVAPTSLTFTSSTWATPQTVTILASNDSAHESTATVNVTFTVVSGDAGYNAKVVAPVAVAVTDDDPIGPPTISFQNWTESAAGAYVASATPNRLYFNPTTTGSASVTVRATDATSTVTKVTWPTAPVGWSPGGGDDTSPSGADYSRTFTWASGAQGGSAYVTATNANGGVTSPGAELQLTPDFTPPSGGSVTYADGAPAAGTASVSFTTGADGAGSGIATSTLQRRDTALTGPGTCDAAAWSTWSATPATSSPYSDSTVALGRCYQYRLAVADNVGNVGTYTSANTVRVEPAGILVVESAAATAVVEGASDGTQTDTFTVQLRSVPIAAVTVAISGGSGQVTAAPVSLTFDPSNWNTPQTVSVTADNDTVHENTATVTLASAATSVDPAYASVTGPSVTVTVTDDDPIAPPTLSFVSWTGGDVHTYVNAASPRTIYFNPLFPGSTTATVHADNPGSTVANVTWPTGPTGWSPAGSVDAAGTVGNYARTFSWSLSAAGGAANITATNTDSLTSTPLTVTFQSDSTAPTGGTLQYAAGAPAGGGVSMAFTTGTDGGGSGIATWRLQRRDTTLPTGGSCDTGGWGTWGNVGTANPTSPYVDSGFADNHCYEYRLVVTDRVGNVLLVGDAETDVVTVEPAGVVVAESASTTAVMEGGATDAITVRLRSQPTGLVTVSLTNGAGRLSLTPASLSFTTSNWMTPQSVTVAAIEDTVYQGTATSNVAFSVSSGDPIYGSYVVPDVVATITDNDPPPPPTLSVVGWTESDAGAFVQGSAPSILFFNPAAGGSATMTVRATDASSTVSRVTWPTIAAGWTPAGSNDTSPSGSDYARTFTWAAGATSGTVNATATNALGATTSPGVAITATADNLAPTGGSITYASGYPVGGIPSITFAAGTDGSGSGIASASLERRTASLTAPGTCGSWSAWTTIASAPSSPYPDATTSMGSCYEYRLHVVDHVGNAQNVAGTTTVRMESPGVDVVATGGSTVVAEAGALGTDTDRIAVALRTPPTASVSLTIGGAAGQVSLSTTSLTFTTTNWMTPQDIDITATDDSVFEGPQTIQVRITAMSADGAYNGLSPIDVPVDIVDNETPTPPTLAVVSWTESVPGAFAPVGTPNRLYFNPTMVGSATALVHATDSVSTVTGVTWPNPPANWSPAGSFATTPAAPGDYARTFSWGVGAAAGTMAVTARNAFAADSTPVTLDLVADGVAPTGVSVSYPGGPPVGSTVTIAVTAGTDGTGSGMASTTLERRDGLLGAGGTCTAWTSWIAISLAPTASNVDGSVALGGCYEYRVVAVDRVGNTTTATSTNTVRMESPAVDVAQSGGSTTIAEDGPLGSNADTIAVSLRTPPTANVTVDLAQTPAGQASLAPSTLTFTPANWNTPQTVTLTALSDTTHEATTTVSIGFTVTSTDPAYDARTVAPVTVTVTDDDPPLPPSISFVSWTESVAGAFVDPGTPDRLYFNPSTTGSATARVRATDPVTSVARVNWATPPAGWSPAGGADTAATANEYVRTVAWTAGALGGMLGATATNVEDATSTPGVSMTLASDSAAPSGGTVDYSDGPAAGASVAVSFNPGTDAGGSGVAHWQLQRRSGALTGPSTCASGGWSAWSNLGAADAASPIVDTTVVTGTCYRYQLVVTDNVGNSATVASTNTASIEPSGVVIAESFGTTSASEAGAVDTYTVRLRSAPTADVQVAMTASLPAQVAVTPATLTFTTANWNVAQTVTVSAVNDSIAEGPHSGSIAHAATSTDSAYASIVIPSLTVSVADNDSAGLMVTAPASTALDEAAASTGARYTVQLRSQPAADVTVTVNPDAQLAVTSSRTLLFTATNWNIAQDVDVVPIDDDVDEAATHAGIASHAVTSTDPMYGSSAGPAPITFQIADNDIAQVVLTPDSGLVVDEAGTRSAGTYTIKLATRPTAPVTITLMPDAQVRADRSTVVLTPTNWSTGLTVNVLAVNDTAIEASTHDGHMAHVAASADTRYANIAIADQVLTVEDDDFAPPVVTPVSWSTSSPAAFVDPTDPKRLFFNPGAAGTAVARIHAVDPLGVAHVDWAAGPSGWSPPAGVGDATIGGDDYERSFTWTAPATGGSVSATASNPHTTSSAVSLQAVADSAAPTGAMARYTGGVVLSASITLGAGVDTGGSGVGTWQLQRRSSTATAGVCATTWGTWSDIGAARPASPYEDTTLASGTCYQYRLMVTDRVGNVAYATDPEGDSVRIEDPGVVMSQSAGTTAVTEGGATDTIAIRLRTAPQANVTVGLSDIGTQLALTPTALTFTPSNWNSAQLVTVSAVDDHLVEDPTSTSINFTVASTDSGFDALVVPGVTVAVADNDVAGLRLRTTGTDTTVAEAGAGDTVTLELTAEPTADVVVTFVHDDQLASIADLIITPAEWDAPHLVTIEAADDSVVEGPTTTVLSASITSTDADFDATRAPDLSVNVTDDDLPAITVVQSGTALDEADAATTQTVDVVLDKQPSSTVRVTAVADTQIEVVSGGVLEFDATDWNTPQQITVAASDDFLLEADQHDGVLSFTVTAPAPSAFDGYHIDDLTFAIADNDVPGITVAPATIAVTEGGSEATISVQLASSPAAAVTLTASGDAQLAIDTGGALTFDATNWNIPRTVRISAVDDAIAEESPLTTSVSFTATSTESRYDGLPVTPVTVTVTDDDIAAVQFVASGDSTAVLEAGRTDTVGVRLATQPVAPVTVTLVPDAQVTATPASLVFTAANWDDAVAVTLAASVDNDVEGEHHGFVAARLSSADPRYADASSAVPTPLDVTIVDNDVAGVTIVESAGGTAVAEGGATDTYTVALSARPSADVTLALDGHGQVTPDPATLTFTADTWSTAQTVTVTAVQDDVDEADPHAVGIGQAFTTTAEHWDVTLKDFALKVADDDKAGVTVTQSDDATAVTEGSKDTDTVSIVLTSMPTADVRITPSSDGQLSVGKAVVIKAADWKQGATLAIGAVDDTVVEGDHEGELRLTLDTADTAYGKIAIASLQVAVTDDDKPRDPATTGDDTGDTEDPTGDTSDGGSDDSSTTDTSTSDASDSTSKGSTSDPNAPKPAGGLDLTAAPIASAGTAEAASIAAKKQAEEKKLAAVRAAAKQRAEELAKSKPKGAGSRFFNMLLDMFDAMVKHWKVTLPVVGVAGASATGLYYLTRRDQLGIARRRGRGGPWSNDTDEGDGAG